MFVARERLQIAFKSGQADVAQKRRKAERGRDTLATQSETTKQMLQTKRR